MTVPLSSQGASEREDSGVPVLFTLFLLLFVGLVVSSVLLQGRDPLPARFIDADATWLAARAEGEGAPDEGARRTLEIDLPDIPRVRMLDMRFGRPESWTVERRDAS